MQVLVVDDSQIMRRIIVVALKKLGVGDIIEAANGQEAFDIISGENAIGLVLMDWNMPIMNWIDAVRKIRAGGKGVPVVMVTTEAEKEKVIQAIKSGANDYLIKPFTQKDIQKKLEKFLQPAGG